MKLKKLINEHHILGDLPSSKLKKMKWNPVTEEEKLDEAPMDKSFAKDFEKSTNAFINHVQSEMKNSDSGADRLVFKKMLQNLRTVQGYPQLMTRLVGSK